MKSMTLRRCILLILITFIPVATFSQVMDAERLARITARINQFVEDGRISGAAMLLAIDGDVVLHEAVGYRELETQDPARPNTIFQVQSMTKPVTAVATMILIEEGRLRLDDPVEDYLPEFRGQTLANDVALDQGASPSPPIRPITVRDLLTHTSGMPHGHHAYATAPPATSLAEVVALNAGEQLVSIPGTRQLYSSLGFETLGRVIEVSSGMPFEQFLGERIFHPLGMQDSFFMANVEQCERIALIYEGDGKTLTRFEGDPCRPFTYPNPAGGMFSTAADMFAFHQMMLQGGTFNGVRILSKASVDVMTAPHAHVAPGGSISAFGLGWWVVDEPVGTLGLPMQSKGAYGHAGLWGTIGWVDPETGLVGVFLVAYNPTLPGRRGTYVRAFAEVFITMSSAAIN